MAMTERAVKGRAGRASLTREGIVEAAIEVIDAAGLAGLTMRRLGAALEVDAMAVYAYFENKAALLDAVVEHEAARLGDLPGELPRGSHRGDAPHRQVPPHRAARAPEPCTGRRQPAAPPATRSGDRPVRGAAAPAGGHRRRRHPGRYATRLVTFILGFILQESGRSQWRAELG